MTDSAKPKRRRYQFSLRTLLVFVLLVSVGLSWLGVKMNQARKQREAVEAIVKAGGVVDYDYEMDEYGRATEATEPAAPAWLRKVFGDDLFREVTCAGLGVNAGDAELEYVKGLTKLEYLDIFDSQVTDAGLEHLNGLTELKELMLLDTQVTDEGVKKLQQALPNCEIFY